MEGSTEYLLVLYKAERRESPPIAPGDVADALDRSPSATTEMLQRLASRDLVEYEPYEGVALTAEGHARAAALYDRYTTLSRFFRDVLGLEDHRDEAVQVAGRVSSPVVERLATTLLDDEADDPERTPVPISTEQATSRVDRSE